MKNLSKLFFALLGACALSAAALAQGQDSTPGERNILIIGELLPGTYSTANQALFDARRGLVEADRHGNQIFKVVRAETEDMAFHFSGSIGGIETAFTMSLQAGPTADEMQGLLSAGGETIDCAITFQRRADHYAGVANGGACEEYGVAEMQVSKGEVWISNASKSFPYWYEHACSIVTRIYPVLAVVGMYHLNAMIISCCMTVVAAIGLKHGVKRGAQLV